MHTKFCMTIDHEVTYFVEKLYIKVISMATVRSIEVFLYNLTQMEYVDLPVEICTEMNH